MKIAVIGLGKMGSVLAKRLLLANFSVTVFNRTPDKMLPLIEAGAKGAKNLQEAVADAEVIITCLLDDNAVFQVVEGFINFLQPNVIHIGTSTILPETSKNLYVLHKSHNSIYIAGNVLGVPKAAEKGQLTSIVAGDAQAIEKCMAVLQAYSAKIINVGIIPYQANVVKICMNYFLVTAIEAMGELYTFAEKSAVNVAILNNLFHDVFAHPAFKLYVDKIKERNFADVNFNLQGGLKDLNIFQKAFADVFVVPDIANIVKDKFIIAMAQGMGEQDWSSVTEITRKQAGLE